MMSPHSCRNDTTLSRQEEHGDMGGWPVAPVQGFGPGNGGVHDAPLGPCQGFALPRLLPTCPVCGGQQQVLGSVVVCPVHGARVDHLGAQSHD